MPSNHFIRNICFQQGFFHYTRLCVRPVQNGKVAVISMIVSNLFLHPVYDKTSFVSFIICTIVSDLVSFFVFCPQVFWFSIAIVFNDLVCRAKNVFRGAIVLFQQNHCSIWIIFFEIQDVLHICTAPAVDTLICISHYA